MTKIVGHRGARGLAPENTLASIEKALEFGVDEIEIDVHVTKDEVVVLVHDPIIHSANANLAIVEHTYLELRSVKADLTTLEEAIRFIDRRVPLVIEVKPNVSVEPVVVVLKDFLEHGWTTNNLLLGSNNQHTLLALHKALPQIPKVVIESYLSVRAVHRAKQVGGRRLFMNQRWLWLGFIRAMHKHGYELYAYTLDNPAKADQWSKHGLAGVITDRPDRYKK